MSLLIKALEKAEQSKQQEPKAALSLEPLDLTAPSKLTLQDFGATTDAVSNRRSQKRSGGQQAAANVFVANRAAEDTSKNVLLMWLLVFAAAIYFGMWLFSYLDKTSQPEIVLSKNTAPTEPSAVAPITFAPSPQATSSKLAPTSSDNSVDLQAHVADAKEKSINKEDSSAVLVVQKPVGEVKKVNSELDLESVNPKSEVGLVSVRREGSVTTLERRGGISSDVLSRTPSMEIRRGTSAPRANSTLIAAYQAFNAGDDVLAQKNYRQVLRDDVANADALLGMAAIAERQGRQTDAMGWYSKVLEVDPQNVVAQSALASNNAQASFEDAESRLKRLLDKQPQAAHLYAALGDLYAGTNQWASAQQAYFQAHHFDAKNADYVFNLAASLDQLGKSALALPFYQQALELQSKFGQSNIDKAQLEARIQQLTSDNHQNN